jgi:hypothetical protein
MATSRTTPTPRRRPIGDTALSGADAPLDEGTTTITTDLASPDTGIGATADSASPLTYVSGPAEAGRIVPMTRHLTDPAVEEWIQRLAASAPPMTEDQRARLSRLLRLNKRRVQRPGT